MYEGQPRLHALVIGCGRIAGGYNNGPSDPLVLTHALAYMRHPCYVLAACVDPDPAARADFARRWRVDACFSTVQEAAHEATCYDIASVCTPTGTHLDTIEQLLDLKVSRVFAEKPLDGDIVRAETIAERYRRAGRKLVVNFTRRWDPELQSLRKDISEGKLGVLRSVVGWYGRGIVNSGAHMLDLVALLTGVRPRLRQVLSTYDDGVVDDPTISAILDVDGIPFHLIGSDGRDYARFEAILSFSKSVVEILEGGLFVRRRPITASEHFCNVDLIADAPRSATGYGVAMLRALDELASGDSFEETAKDTMSAIASIALAVEIRRRSVGELRA